MFTDVIEPELPPCYKEIDGAQGYVNSTDISDDLKNKTLVNQVPLDCMWIIKVKVGWKVGIKC